MLIDSLNAIVLLEIYVQMILIDGKKTSAEVKADIKQEVEAFKAKGGKTPHLAAILVGNDGASETYVASKVRSCNEVGFDSTLERMGKKQLKRSFS